MKNGYIFELFCLILFIFYEEDFFLYVYYFIIIKINFCILIYFLIKCNMCGGCIRVVKFFYFFFIFK